MKYASYVRGVAVLAVVLALGGSARAEYTVPAFGTSAMTVRQLAAEVEGANVTLVVRDADSGERVDPDDPERASCRVVFDPATRGTTVGDGGQLRVTSVCTERRLPPNAHGGSPHYLMLTLGETGFVVGTYLSIGALGLVVGFALRGTRSQR